MLYQVIGPDGFGVDIEAVDWMMAMCEAIRVQDISVSSWACRPQGDRAVLVTDPRSGRSWSVALAAEVEEHAPAGVRPRSPYAVPTPPMPVPLGDGPHQTFYVDDEDEGATSEAPEDLAEQLFELSADLSGAEDPNGACRLALDVAMSLVPCEAGSVLRGSLNDDALTFVAARGPSSAGLLGRRIPFGQGLSGAAHDQGVTIVVDKASGDSRHLRRFDEETGFQTKAVVCVPIRTEEAFFGVMQLLNPRDRFHKWHIEVAETAAQSLAATLSGL